MLKIKTMTKIHSALKQAAFFQLFFVFLLSSCTETINFDAELTEPKLVVHSYITVGEPISAIIRESKFFLNDTTQHEFVKDADVSVYVNNSFVEKLKIKINSWNEVEYIGEYFPQQNDKIKLVIKRTGKADVFAETQIETPINIIQIDTTSKDIQYIYNYENEEVRSYYKNFKLNFELQLRDDGSKKNYYRLVVERVEVLSRELYDSEGSTFAEVNFTNNSTDANNNKNPLESALNEIWGVTRSEIKSYNIFKDDTFNDKIFNLKFSCRVYLEIRNPNFSGSVNDFYKGKKVIYRVYIQSITKDFYEYMASLSALANTNPFFSEAVQIKSNINGGIGILGAYTNSNIVEFEFVEY